MVPQKRNFDLKMYSNEDFAECRTDWKSNSETCPFLGPSLVSWFSNKHNVVALSTAEAEYIVAGGCCVQFLWMKQILEDLGLPHFEKIRKYCENTSAISLSKNLVQHLRVENT